MVDKVLEIYSFMLSATAEALQIGHKFFIDSHFLMQLTW